LDRDTLALARAAIEAQPSVVRVRSVTGRSAGRYRFLEAEVGLRVTDLEKGHQVSHAIEQAIREQVPHVERVLIHVEPERKAIQRVAVAMVDLQSTVGEHFGSAPYFALIEIRMSDGERLDKNVLVNLHQADEKQRGLNVARWLISENVDVIISGDDLRDKAPGYVFAEAGVELQVAEVDQIDTAIEQWYESVDR
jgi:predicted Fe-Mo cluster-binding NifX family protein